MKARIKIKGAVKETLVKAARSRGITVEKKRKITYQPKGVILLLTVSF